MPNKDISLVPLASCSDAITLRSTGYCTPYMYSLIKNSMPDTTSLVGRVPSLSIEAPLHAAQKTQLPLRHQVPMPVAYHTGLPSSPESESDQHPSPANGPQFH